MTAIDVCQAPSAQVAPSATTGAEFSCTACGESFPSTLEHRAHFKSERHVYNTKRKQNGLKAISQEAWERKLRESRGDGGTGEQKGTAHLKAKKVEKKTASGDALPPSSEGGSVEVTEEPVSPRRCLFDRQHFETIEKCLTHMEKTYSFFIPDREYCIDRDGLLAYLGHKVSEPPYACINCNRRFPDAQSVRRHMLDKGHTQIGSEVFSRSGRYDEASTNELQSELEPFYDFHASVREVAEKINNPQQKVASILRFFDADKNQTLDYQEVSELWAATSDGEKFSEAQYEGACAMCEANPQEGLDVEALGKLYASGLADLDQHFTILQDLIVKRRRKPLTAVEEEKLTAVEEEKDGDEDDDEEAEEEDGEEEDDEDGDEVVECEDEDEFEEVMRVLGLQPVTILPTGDLRLPNGSVATHRDVQHIYRQRGARMDENQLAIHKGSKVHKRSLLMLSNANTSGCLKIAMTQRQEAKEGKRIIAVLRDKQNYDMRMGIRQNLLMKQHRTKIRTGRGDMSCGR